ncbi:MAG: 23S rRNA (guanosine(2251)-2'-O)-methyltransferase RlmB [Bacteroidota bacterium]
MIKNKDFIFGVHAVTEAIRSGKELDKVLIARKTDGETLQELFSLVREREIPFQFVPFEKLNKITRKNHQGIIAFISEITYYPFQELITRIYESGNDPLFLILEGVSDVRNFGAIARSAECLGFNGIVIPEKGAARINADAVKTSAGALMNLPVSRVKSLPNTIKNMNDYGIHVFGISEKTDKKIFHASLSGPLALLMGSEDKGISENLLYLCEDSFSIPMSGKTESLNVSVAASIAMYEVVRQRLKS